MGGGTRNRRGWKVLSKYTRRKVGQQGELHNHIHLRQGRKLPLARTSNSISSHEHHVGCHTPQIQYRFSKVKPGPHLVRLTIVVAKYSLSRAKRTKSSPLTQLSPRSSALDTQKSLSGKLKFFGSTKASPANVSYSRFFISLLLLHCS